MRALTIWPEWIWAIQYLGKTVENRSWTPPAGFIGERIALHAGAHVGGRPGMSAMRSGLKSVGNMASREGWGWMFGEYMDYMSFIPTNNSLGGVCEMYLLDDDRELSPQCKRLVKGAIVGTAVIEKVEHDDFPRWGVPGMAHWHLSDVSIFPSPIPAKGKQRLWKVNTNQELEMTIQQFLLEKSRGGRV